MIKQGIGAALVVASLSLALITTANAAVSTTVDFEDGLTEGDIVSALSNGTGISGGAVSGAIVVNAERTGSPAGNDAMIFDATCAGGCSGGDSDLNAPGQGNVLIISEDNEAADPDDAAVGGVIDLDFAGFDGGAATVVSLVIIDTEEGGEIEVFVGGLGGASQGIVAIPSVLDGVVQTVNVGLTGDFMRITLNGSGAIDGIELQTGDEEEIDGWMTGGGNITEGRGRSAVLFSTHGFIIRCDASFAQFQYNDHLNGGNFHLENVETVLCTDEAGYGPHPPAADFDTLTMTGTGRWNGVSGATVIVTLTDTGQPANADVLDIKVWATADQGVAPVSERVGNLTVGNHQAH